MMRLADIERHVGSMEELGRIVGAMRSIASLRVQDAARALASVREYGQALAQAVRQALAIVGDAAGAGAGTGTGAVVVFTSEHGFVGGFNERLIAALEEREASKAAGSARDAADALYIVGSRGAAFAAERGRPARWTHAMASRIGSLPDIARRIAEALYPGIARGETVRAEVLFGRHHRSGVITVERRRLFPLDLPAAASACRPLPLHDLPAIELLERLTAEYILAQLTEAATESFAAENGARFAAMESAHENVERKLEALRLEAARARQEEVTTELLDLLIGEQAAAER